MVTLPKIKDLISRDGLSKKRITDRCSVIARDRQVNQINKNPV